MEKMAFPQGFKWGVATAAYQVEGFPLSDGAGPSIWHRFSHTFGTTRNGDTGDVACDHYHKYKEDVSIMRKLGIKAYRFSIAWPRIFPNGKGKLNLKGMDFYDRLVDELMTSNIEPFVTLYHWDLPAHLQDEGGWTNEDVANWFADYADFVFQKLGDRVKHWITLNEPWVTAFIGHMFGIHAPGMKDTYAALKVVHNQLRAHSKAVKAFRDENLSGKIGITLSNHSQTPASQNENDVMAAEVAHEWTNYPLFLNPIFKGEYPEHFYNAAREYFPRGYEKDMDDINVPIDFVGINYYSGNLVKADERAVFGVKNVERGVEKTDMGWEIYPQGLYEILTGVQNTYHPNEIFITENGAAFKDKLEDGKVHDEKRINYLKSHFEQAHRALENGVNLKGYFVWSLMDNFEWAEGYSKRFGIVYVDYKTQKRVIKDSGYWYSEVISKNSIS